MVFVWLLLLARALEVDLRLREFLLLHLFEFVKGVLQIDRLGRQLRLRLFHAELLVREGGAVRQRGGAHFREGRVGHL